MSGDPDADASFDPRSWGRGTAVTSPPVAQPRTAKLANPKPPIVLTPVRALAAKRSDRRLMSLGISAAILLAAAAAAYRARPAIAPPPAAVIETPVVAAAVPAPVAPASASRRTLVLASADEIGPMLLAAGVAPAQAKDAARMATARLGDGAGELRVVYAVMDDADGGAVLQSLVATRADGAGVSLAAGPDGFAARAIAAVLTRQVRTVRGEIDATSFYSSAVAAGVDDSLIDDFAAAFAFDFDFQREVRPGDVFEATIARSVTPDGTPTGQPLLVYAALTTAERARALYRWTPPDGEPGWYDGNGGSIVRALMRTPVDGARISSNFGYRRHPILGFQKLHRGTDFAAPTGTPIYASGDATVGFAAFKGANGNFVRLHHDNGWTTLYLHLSRFAPGLTPGIRVRQGEPIGEVGTTGRSTGPHLHYEVHIDGQPVDPISIPTGGTQRLSGADLAGFKETRDRIDVSRAKLGA